MLHNIPITLTIYHRLHSECERIEQVSDWRGQAARPRVNWCEQGYIVLFQALRKRRQLSSVQLLFVGVFVMQLIACATPTSKLIDIADKQGLERADVKANGFEHLVLQKTASVARSSTLHVYLEGDGTPWKYRVLRMRDPTPRYPLMLELMAADESPAVYLGRPCYNGSFDDPGCSDDLWTSARYSDQVVSSMAAAVKKLQQSTGATNVRLFGHSGGGALALLMAERIPDVTHIVTLAGNLDTEAWVAHHGYTPLYGSLNPANRDRLRESVVQWHLIGRNDTVIPPSLVKRFILLQPNVFATEIDRFTHGCCWSKIWPTVLSGLSNNDTRRIPGARLRARRVLTN